MQFISSHQIAFSLHQESVVGLHFSRLKRPHSKIWARVKVWAPNLPRINFWIKCCCVLFCEWWKEAACEQTHALQPPPEGQYLADSLQPLFVLPIPSAAGAGGVNSCVCLPRAGCPSNCPVVRRRVPPEALSDSSKTLQAVQVLTPWAQTTPRLPWGRAARPGLVPVCANPVALSPGGFVTAMEHLPGEGTRGPGKWKVGGTRRRVRQLLVSAWG